MPDTGHRDEPGWPEEGGRSFARGTWANVGPFTYRDNSALRIATKAVVWLIFAWFVAAFTAYTFLTGS